MALGLSGKLLVIGIITGIIIVILVIFICFVGPGCWGHEYILRGSKKRKNRAYLELKDSKNIIQLKEIGKGAWLSENGSSYESVCSTIMKLEQPQPHKSKLNGNIDVESIPRLFFNLLYTILDQERLAARLTLDILEIKCLPSREYTNIVDSYLRVELFQKTKNGEEIVDRFETEVVKHTLNPVYNQRFSMDGVIPDLKTWSIKIYVYDKDKLLNENVICECKFDLKHHENLLLTNDTVPMKIDLIQKQNTFGEILFGMLYFPTAQRLKLCIIKAINLKPTDFVPTLSEFYPYVKVLLVSRSGKCIKKRKTNTKHLEISPIFNETLIFDVSPKDLENVTVIVVLANKVIEYINGDSSSVDSESSKTSSAKDQIIGKVFLGRNVKNRKGRDHWITLMQNPRKIVSVWHTLT